MASEDSVPCNSINFPAFDSPPPKPVKSVSPLRGPHLPFRRISLPTAPSLQNRISVASLASFDSLFEEAECEPSLNAKVLPRVPEKPDRSHSAFPDPSRRRKPRDNAPKAADNRQKAKRRNIVEEFYETEKAYVDGLELIYSHFLTPIIASLDSPEPLLDRSALTSIFSNFIDIWNLHRSFLSSLSTLLEPTHAHTSPPSHSSADLSPPELSPLLLSHFPYLSLYTPFVTAFPSTISALSELTTASTPTRPSPQYNQRFATFLSTQEADPRCGKLKLRDWLLTIVQRCPRYLLLLKDLINAISEDDPEHAQLTAVHALVSKITMSLNTSLHTHAQTMALLSIQRSTPNLPFQLISPGRMLLKRGPLLQIERSGSPVEREFFLFSDCMVWLAAAEPLSQSWDWSWSGSGSGGSTTGASQSSHNTPTGSKITGERPPMTRSRSKSEAELSTVKKVQTQDAKLSNRLQTQENGKDASPATPLRGGRGKTPVSPPPPPNMNKRRYSIDDKWIYKGRIELVDVQVILGSALEDTRKFEILSPEGSFMLYGGSEAERDEWASEIRNAKAQLLDSLNVTKPNSTLTSSASTNHVRRALRALPYHPEDDRLGTIRVSSSVDAVNSASHQHLHGKFRINKKEKSKQSLAAERRRKVDHWVPAIWIPDDKAAACMRCGRTFGWRRRRHHCRLCGRCVCAACSERTFYISDSSDKHESKPARACNACYESVFPVVDANPETSEASNGSRFGPEGHNGDTITSLSGLPSWLSMPALPVQRLQPHALMALSIKPGRSPYPDSESMNDLITSTDEREQRAGLRVRSHQRLRSNRQVAEDFSLQKDPTVFAKFDNFEVDLETLRNMAEAEELLNPENYNHGDEAENLNQSAQWHTPSNSALSSPISSPRKQRNENTARRSKRFSLPAVALHTTSVTAHTTEMPTAVIPAWESSHGEQVAGPVLTKRFSLVLGGRNSHGSELSRNQPFVENNEMKPRSLASARLSELLGRKKE